MSSCVLSDNVLSFISLVLMYVHALSTGIAVKRDTTSSISSSEIVILDINLHVYYIVLASLYHIVYTPVEGCRLVAESL